MVDKVAKEVTKNNCIDLAVSYSKTEIKSTVYPVFCCKYCKYCTYIVNSHSKHLSLQVVSICCYTQLFTQCSIGRWGCNTMQYHSAPNTPVCRIQALPKHSLLYISILYMHSLNTLLGRPVFQTKIRMWKKYDLSDFDHVDYWCHPTSSEQQFCGQKCLVNEIMNFQYLTMTFVMLYPALKLIKENNWLKTLSWIWRKGLQNFMIWWLCTDKNGSVILSKISFWENQLQR